MNIEVGVSHEINVTVTDKMSAASMRSGSLNVLATPFMVALMEQAASELCDKYVPEGISTVGTALNISHLAATAIGMNVKAIAEVTAFDGRKISFNVKAFDDAGLIGEGTHERFTVKIDKFMLKAEERKQSIASN